jgi:hypothetical protein
MRERTNRLVLAVVCVAGSFSGCWRLPKDFPEFSLDRRIDVYASHFRHGGARESHAEDLIAAHGYAAAEAMVPYLHGKAGIPPFVAINLIWDFQYRGCNLRSSSAVEALRQLLAKDQAQTDERGAAQAALQAVVSGKHGASASEELSAEACRPKQVFRVYMSKR